MKILIIDNASMVTTQSGHHYTNNLNGLFLSEMMELGNDITYIQFALERADSISVYDLEEHGVKCVELKSKVHKLLRYVLAVPKLAKEIKRTDFVYFYYPNSFRWATLLCRMYRKPYGLYIRGMNGVEDSTSHNIYKHAYTAFTVSDQFTNMVNAVTKKEMAHTIRPMIPYTDADVIMGRDYAPKEVYNILFLGRIAKDKGLEELMQAARQLRDKGYRFMLRVVGNGEFIEQTAQLVAGMELKDCVSLEGPVYDDAKKAEYYKNADLYVLPTYHEGFPRTLYEAMIFGAPIITTFVGGIPALMKDGENCKRIEPRSADSIIEGLSYAMDNYAEMGKMANDASRLVSKIVNRNRMTHAQHLNQILKDYNKRICHN